MPRPRKESHKIVRKDLGTGSSLEHARRAVLQAPLGQASARSACKDFTRISTRSSDKDLYKSTQGPLWGYSTRISTKLLTRTCARSCKDLLEDSILTRSSHKDLYKTSSTAQGGGRSFKERKPIEVGCCGS